LTVRLAETLAGFRVNGILPGEILPAANCKIDEARLDLSANGDSSGTLGCQDRCSRSTECVNDNITTARAILDGRRL
jgi:hypothetical protein